MHAIQEEYLDIVDATDTVITQVPRSQIYFYGKHGSYFRAVNAFIENDKGQLWIPRRTATKKLFPLALDTSIGGAVSAGESYEQSLIREAQEEVYLDLAVLGYQEIAYLSPLEHGTSCFTKVYIIKYNEAPRLNTDDFCESYWLTPQEIMARIASGDASKSDLPVIIRECYLKA